MIATTRFRAMLMLGFMLVHRASSHLYLTAFSSSSAGANVGFIANMPYVFAAAGGIVVLGALVLALVVRQRISRESMPVVVPCLLGIAGCVPGALSLELGGWFPVVAGLVYAGSITVLNYSWYELLAREGALEGTITLAVAILGSSLFANALAGVDQAVLYVLDALFLAAGSAMLVVLRRTGRLSASAAGPVPSPREALDRNSMRMAAISFTTPLATLAVLEMTVGTLNVTAVNGYSAVMNSVPMWVSTGLGAGLFLAVLLFAKAPKSSEVIYLRLFPMFMALLGVFVVCGESMDVPTGVLMLVTYNFFTFSVAYALFDVCNQQRVNPYFLMSVNLIVIKLALMVGLGVGLAIINFFSQLDVSPLTTTLVFVMYMLAMVALLVSRRVSKTINGRGAAAVAGAGVAADDDAAAVAVAAAGSPAESQLDAAAMARFAEAHGLTPREREVFELVARGWGAKQISDSLSVSENTVWSHVKHIYAKLGVQSKQEAINLWEGSLGER